MLEKNKIMVKLKRKVEYCLEGDRISIGARKQQVSELFPSSILRQVFKCSLSGSSPLVISATKSLSHFWVSFGVLFFILFSKKMFKLSFGKTISFFLFSCQNDLKCDLSINGQ